MTISQTSSTPKAPSVSVCSCGGLGYFTYNVPVGHPYFGRHFPCVCRAGLDSERLQNACGLNPDERLLTLDSIKTSSHTPGTLKMKTAAQHWLQDAVGMFTVFGSYGNAKTILLMAVVNECIKRGLPAVYTTYPSLLDYIRAGYEEHRATGEYGSAFNRMQRFLSVRVLAIDELEDARETEWAQEFTKSFFDRRYRDGNSRLTGTLLATNKSPRSFLDDKIVSRIYDGRNIVVENSDPDMRSKMRRGGAQ